MIYFRRNSINPLIKRIHQQFHWSYSIEDLLCLVVNMANWSSLEDSHTHLDALHDKAQKLDGEKKELPEHLKRSTTSEEKSKIFEAMKTLNETINSIIQARMKILDLIKIQLEKGRFSLYLNFSHLIYCFFILKKELLVRQLKRFDEVFHRPPLVQNGHLIFFDRMLSISQRFIPSTSYSFKQLQSCLVCALLS